MRCNGETSCAIAHGFRPPKLTSRNCAAVGTGAICFLIVPVPDLAGMKKHRLRVSYDVLGTLTVDTL